MTELNVAAEREESAYRLMIDLGKRDIALLGFDFIDRCSFKHTSKDDIILTEFDDQGYGAADGAIDSDELIAFIDSLS